MVFCQQYRVVLFVFRGCFDGDFSVVVCCGGEAAGRVNGLYSVLHSRKAVHARGAHRYAARSSLYNCLALGMKKTGD